MTKQNKADRLRDGGLLEIFINNQLSIVGKTLVDVESDDNFRFNNTITRNQYNSFRDHCIFLLQKNFKINRRKANDSFRWFYQNYGLRIKG